MGKATKKDQKQAEYVKILVYENIKRIDYMGELDKIGNMGEYCRYWLLYGSGGLKKKYGSKDTKGTP